MSCTSTGVLRNISTYPIAGALSQPRFETRARLTANPSERPIAKARTHSSIVTTSPRSKSGKLSRMTLKSHVYSIGVSLAGARESILGQAHEVAGCEQHDEVHDGDGRVNLHRPERDAVHLHRLVEQLSIGERRCQGGGLGQFEGTIDEGRDHPPQRLRQDHAA